MTMVSKLKVPSVCNLLIRRHHFKQKIALVVKQERETVFKPIEIGRQVRTSSELNLPETKVKIRF